MRMAIDQKYGRVTLELGTVGEDEPVIVFRAQDAILPLLLGRYYILCEENGTPEKHLKAINKAKKAILEWQKINKTKIPD